MSQKKFKNISDEGKCNKQAGVYPASPQICPRFNKSFIKQRACRLAQIRRNDEEIKNTNGLKSKQEKSNPKSPSKRSPVKKEKEQKIEAAKKEKEISEKNISETNNKIDNRAEEGSGNGLERVSSVYTDPPVLFQNTTSENTTSEDATFENTTFENIALEHVTSEKS